MSKTSSASLLNGVDSWESFQKRVSSFGTKEKGDAFELICKLYLKLDPVYAATLEDVWLLKEVPFNIRAHLNLPHSDNGIDIIARTYKGEYWAIQCKYRDNKDASLGWGEISTFIGLAFKLSRNIGFGLICHTGNKYTKLIEKQQGIGFCSNEVWQKLDKDFFDRARETLETKKAPSFKPAQPQKHQQRAVNKAKDYFGFLSTTRGKLIMPCGTGKSLTAYWIAESLDAKRIVVVVPSLALIKQTLNVWLKEFKAVGKYEEVAWMCVCSDASVTAQNDDELLSTVGELGIPCTTKRNDIREWARSADESSIQVVFTTYQSSKSLADACRLEGFTFDLGIFDEAHKTVGHLDSPFSYLLNDDNLEIKRRLFMTATERFYSGNKDKVASMNDSSIYGETFETLTFKEALNYKPPIIADYRILTLFVTKKEVREMVIKNKYVRPLDDSWSDEVEAKMLASIVALNKAMDIYPITHTVTYHSNIKRAKSFAKYVETFLKKSNNQSSVETYHVSGSMPTSVRGEILQSFANSEAAIVTNARCLVEGVDVPNIDCILFADPRRSKIDIVQALGRALRPTPNKKHGYIVIPVVVDEDEDIEDFLDSSEYSDLLKTLRDLASNDERVVEYFNIRDANGEFHRLASGASSELISMHFASNINLDEFIKSIELSSWDRLSKLSFRKFGSAKRFVHSLGLHSEKEWKFYCMGLLHGLNSKPIDLPLDPAGVYEDDWTGWKDWLGSQSSGKRYVSFELARRIVHKLELNDASEWQQYIEGKFEKYHGEVWPYIPPNPKLIYFKEWKGWEDWLGAKEYPNFSLARTWARTLRLKNRKEWFTYANEAWEKERNGISIGPFFNGLPKRPDFVYRDQWKNWGDWLDTLPKGYVDSSAQKVETVKKKKTIDDYLSFEDARKFARSLKGLITINDWMLYTRGNFSHLPPLPENIPKRPDKIYRSQWKGMRDWLAPRENIRDLIERSYFKRLSPGGAAPQQTRERTFKLGTKMLPFEIARTHVRNQNLRHKGDWYKYSMNLMKEKMPSNIPTNPDEYYRKEWQGWIDWLLKP